MVSMTPVILTLDAAERVCAEHGWAFEIHPTLYGRTVQVWGDAGYTENSALGADTVTRAREAVLAALRGEWMSYKDIGG